MRALRPDHERAELVRYLKTLKQGELAAYCSGVLSAYALHTPPEIAEAVNDVMCRGRRTKVIDLTSRRPIICPDCGHEVERSGKPGRPRTRHVVCPEGIAARRRNGAHWAEGSSGSAGRPSSVAALPAGVEVAAA